MFLINQRIKAASDKVTANSGQQTRRESQCAAGVRSEGIGQTNEVLPARKVALAPIQYD